MSIYLPHRDQTSFATAFTQQRRVLLAIMLRNIRTRFFGHGAGYLIAIAWPLSHILILIAIFAAIGRAPPVGESAVVFVATGTIPFMTFSYISRFMQISVITTRPLFAFPEVKAMDALLASAILEFLASCCVTIILLIIAWSLGVDAMPRDIVEASYAFGAVALLGVGFGLLNGVIALVTPLWMTGYALLSLGLWMTAGVFFIPDALPEPIRTILSYHPVLQCIEWMRSAYYEGYGEQVLDRGYVLKFGLVSIFLGLLIERGMRGHLLATR